MVAVGLWVCVGGTEASGTEQDGAPSGEGAQGRVGLRREAWVACGRRHSQDAPGRPGLLV